ncbi:MAG: TonB-dependent receptor [Nitrospirota bacterium]|nr:TonB-dependent receptor [Nitrospirota bacterium]
MDAHEESSSSVQQLPEVLVTDTRLPSIQENILSVPSKITVLTAEDIQQSGARTVQEAVVQTTGVVMHNQVGNAFEQTIDFRGYNGNPVSSTSVFIDGIRVNDPEFGFVNFDLLPLETIERMEIIPSSSAIYGNNAMGGVINILTKRGAEQRQMTGETAFGSFGRQRYTFNTSGPIGKFDYFGSLSRERENGYRDDSEGKLSRGFGKVGYRPVEGTDLTISYTYVKDNLEQAGSLPRNLAGDDPKKNFTPGDFVDRENNFVRLTARQVIPGGFTFTGNGFYRRLEQESFLVSQPFTVGGNNSTSQNLVDTKSWGGVFQLAHEFEVEAFRNTLSVGGEVAWNEFGNRLLSLSDFGPFNIRRKTEEEVTAMFVQDTVNLFSKIILVGGFRFDRTELDFRDRLTPANDGRKVFRRTTPRAGLTYFLVPQTSVYFSYSQGFRVPTNDELFAQGTFGSNPNLQPVRSHNYEFGLKSKVSSWGDVALAVYQSNIRDEIFFTCLACDFSPMDGQNRNVPKSRRRGFELTFKVKPNKLFDGVVNYTYTEAQFRSRFNISSTRVVDVGDSFPLVPKNRLGVTGTLHPIKGLSLSLSGLYASTQFLQSDESNEKDRLQGYFVLNSRIAYEHAVPGGILKGFLGVNNLLDNNYQTSGIYAANRITGGGATEQFVVPAPGIGFFGGLNYRFESFPF